MRTPMGTNTIPVASDMSDNSEVRKSPHVDIRWLKDVERVLITEQQLARRIGEMAQSIQRDFSGREMVVVSVLSGTVMFLADLIRYLNLPMRLDFIGVSSYGT